MSDNLTLAFCLTLVAVIAVRDRGRVWASLLAEYGRREMRLNGHTVILAVALAACSHAKHEPDPATPTDKAQALYTEASHRLMASHVEHTGFVVSHKPDGSADHVGEAILWSGVAMTALACPDAEIVAAGMADEIVGNDGWPSRYEPLPDEYKGKELNFDGETGLEAGVAGFAVRCPGQADRIKQAWGMHKQRMDAAGGEVYPGTGSRMTGFGFTQTAISHVLLGGPAPGDGSQTEMEGLAIAWAHAVQLARSPAYRVHLAYRHLRAAEALGYGISSAGRDAFCQYTTGLDMPNVDNWCGRGNLAAWVDAFVWNRFEYQFQRAAAYETPDGDGDETPGVDLIEAIHDVYRIDDHVGVGTATPANVLDAASVAAKSILSAEGG